MNKDLVTVNGSLDSKHTIECQYTHDLVRDIKGYEYRTLVSQKLDESGWKDSPQRDFIIREVCRKLVDNSQLLYCIENPSLLGINIGCGNIPHDLFNITFDENKVGVGPGEVALTLLFKNCTKSTTGDIKITNNYFKKEYIAEIKGFSGRIGKNGDGEIKNLIKNCKIDKNDLLEMAVDVPWPSSVYINDNPKIKKLFNMVNQSVFEFDKIDFPGIRAEFNKISNRRYYSSIILDGFIKIFYQIEQYANAYSDITSKSIGESKKLRYYLMSKHNSVNNDYELAIETLLKFNSDEWPQKTNLNKIIKKVMRILSKSKYYELCGNGRISDYMIKLGTAIQLYSYWLHSKFDLLIVFNKDGSRCITIKMGEIDTLNDIFSKLKDISINTGISRNNGFGLCLL